MKRNVLSFGTPKWSNWPWGQNLELQQCIPSRIFQVGQPYIRWSIINRINILVLTHSHILKPTCLALPRGPPPESPRRWEPGGARWFRPDDGLVQVWLNNGSIQFLGISAMFITLQFGIGLDIISLQSQYTSLLPIKCRASAVN